MLAVTRAVTLCSVLAAVVTSTTPGIAQAQDSSRPNIQFYRKKDSNLPFSPAVRVGDVLYLSGQIGFRSDGSLPGDIASQTKEAMERIRATLALAGRSMDDVFKCTVMLADISQWEAFNNVYVTYFKPERLPVRSAFQAAGLAFGAALELECMAHAPTVK